jgi:hypothetical protein
MKGLTLNEEPNIDHPYASRDCYDESLPVPYGNTDSTHERWTAASQECKGRTYMRCTIKSDAAARVKYPKN